MNINIVKADKDLFAVYQTIYSNADIEMWFDWERRLKDTKDTEECFFLMDGDTKIGGFIYINNKIAHPFLINPFNDRFAFWSFIIKHYNKPLIRGVLKCDWKIIQMFGYKTKCINHVMIRPTDIIKIDLADGFICRDVDFEKDKNDLAYIMYNCYNNTIMTEIEGEMTIESCIENAVYMNDAYDKANFSKIIIDKNTNKSVAMCTTGMYSDKFSELGELCVLPEYRGKGLAQYLMANAITDSHKLVPYIKLFVHVENSAEHTYYNMGFNAGPTFIHMDPR